MQTDAVKAKLIEILIGTDHEGWSCQDKMAMKPTMSYHEYDVSTKGTCHMMTLKRPMQLADVLRALKGNVGKYVAVTFDGDFLSREYGADSWIMSVETWKLLSDYDGQSQETKDFIGKLINA